MKSFLIALFAAVSVSPASATVFHYTLQNASFQDGGTMSGTFDYDTSSGLGAFSLSTTAGVGFAARTYTNANTTGAGSTPDFVYAFTTDGYFELFAQSYQTSTAADSFLAGGTVMLATSQSDANVKDGAQYRFFNPGAEAVAGDVSVPEPAMLGLFGLGAVGLCLTRRRKI